MQKGELAEQLRQALAQPSQAMNAAIELLARLRPMRPAGAALVLGKEPGLGSLLAQGPDAAPELADRLMYLAQAQRCLGCGTCCLTSSPTLYSQDLERISPQGLPREALYALRAGEKVSSAREGNNRHLERELIKLRESQRKGGSSGIGCVFLQAVRCGIYEQRPLQCRVMECWSGSHAGQLAGQPRLTRAMLFASDETALALIQEYDLKLPAAELTQALEAAAQGDTTASQCALAMLELDHNLRRGVSQRYEFSSQDLDLMWGRPAILVARSHGLEAVIDKTGKPALQTMEPAKDS